MRDPNTLLNRYVHDRTPARAPSFDLVLARARRASMRRRAGGAAAAAAVVATGGVAVATLSPIGGGEEPSGVASSAVAPSRVAPSGALPDGGAASCAFAYEPDMLAERGFAFDATITGVDGPVERDGIADHVVTFRVEEWFTGPASPPAEVTVMMASPRPAGLSEYPGPDGLYGVGTRLLVSGDFAAAGDFESAFVWGCGFTRYYDEQAAAGWREATN